MSETTDPRTAASQCALKDAAIALIAEQGLDGVTVRAVAARAGLSKSLAGHHFQSKDSLIAAVARDLMAPASPPVMDGDELVRLAALCKWLLTQGAADAVRGRALMVLLGAVQSAGAPREGQLAWQRVILTRFHGLLTDGVRSRVIRGDIEPRMQAFLLLSGVYGALWLAFTRGEGLDVGGLGDALIDQVIANLSPQVKAPPDAGEA